jgi:hypothetical protein
VVKELGRQGAQRSLELQHDGIPSCESVELSYELYSLLLYLVVPDVTLVLSSLLMFIQFTSCHWPLRCVVPGWGSIHPVSTTEYHNIVLVVSLIRSLEALLKMKQIAHEERSSLCHSGRKVKTSHVGELGRQPSRCRSTCSFAGLGPSDR